MLSILVTILFWVFIGALIWWLVGMLPIDAKFKQVIMVILILIAIVFLIGLLYGSVPVFPVLRG